MNRVFRDFEEFALVLQDQEAKLLQLALQMTYLRGKIDGYRDNKKECMGHVHSQCHEISRQLHELTNKFKDDYLKLG